MTDLYRLAVIDGAAGAEAVIESAGMLLPVGALVPEFAGLDDLMPLLQDWARSLEAIERCIAADGNAFAAGSPARAAKFRSPIAAPGKLICVGANYHDHIREMPIPMVPKYPYTFLKPVNNTVRGSGDPVTAPRSVKMMDYEAELGVVIGSECVNVSAADALAVVAGYVNFNDLSARDALADRPPIGVDWVWHKGYDGFAPMGPYIVPARFIPDPQDLPIKLSVNGDVRQDSSTAEMVFGVAACIEHLSNIMTLYPGDVIATGTPAGVAHGRAEQAYLVAGDEIWMQVGSLGELVTPIV